MNVEVNRPVSPVFGVDWIADVSVTWYGAVGATGVVCTGVEITPVIAVGIAVRVAGIATTGL